LRRFTEGNNSYNNSKKRYRNEISGGDTKDYNLANNIDYKNTNVT